MPCGACRPLLGCHRYRPPMAHSAWAPIEVVSSATDDQVAFWLADGLVHAVGDDLEEATEAFLDALVDYSQCWFDDLQDAPNHAHNLALVRRVAFHSGDRGELRRVVFGH